MTERIALDGQPCSHGLCYGFTAEELAERRANPGRGIFPPILFAPDRKRPTYNRIPAPEGGGGRKSFAGQDDDV